MKKLIALSLCFLCIAGCTANESSKNQSSKNSLTKENIQENEDIQDKKEKVSESSVPTITDKVIGMIETVKNETEEKVSTNEATQSSKQVASNTPKPSTPSVTENPNIESTTNPAVVPTPTPTTPVPQKPSVVCPGGVDPNSACELIIDKNFYFATFSSQSEATNQGEYYLNDIMYIGGTEITNYSVQPVYRNNHSIAYYGLNLWSNGSLIQ